MMNKLRFNPDADCMEGAKEYIYNTAIQLLKHDIVHIASYDENGQALRSLWLRNGEYYQSIYILKSHRGKGLFHKLWQQNMIPILTMDRCNLVDYLKHKDISHVIIPECDIYIKTAYHAISKEYGDTHASRSNVPYMNHIDEGLAILSKLGAGSDAESAYCLHPIFQEKAIRNRYTYSELRAMCDNSNIQELVNEYEYFANRYLSTRKIKSIDEIALPTFQQNSDLHLMLVADKIQNAKDFEIYHLSHPRYEELTEYFQNWFDKLGVTEELYHIYFNALTIRGL